MHGLVCVDQVIILVVTNMSILIFGYAATTEVNTRWNYKSFGSTAK